MSLVKSPSSLQLRLNCRIMYNLTPFLTKYKIPLDKSPFGPNHMAELLVLLQKSAINGIPTRKKSRSNVSVDGAKLILRSYFESPFPKPPIYGTLLLHPLLKTLVAQGAQDRLREVRQEIIEIINSTEIKTTTSGPESLQRSYMGQLMKRYRGKVEADRASKLLKEEMDRRLEFIPRGNVFSVRQRTADEIESLDRDATQKQGADDKQ